MSAHLVIDKQLTLNWFSTFLARKPLENQGQCVCHFFCRLRLDMNQFQCKKIVYFANCNCRDELKITFYSLRHRIVVVRVSKAKQIRQKRKPTFILLCHGSEPNRPCYQSNMDIAHVSLCIFKAVTFLKVY